MPRAGRLTRLLAGSLVITVNKVAPESDATRPWTDGLMIPRVAEFVRQIGPQVAAIANDVGLDNREHRIPGIERLCWDEPVAEDGNKSRRRFNSLSCNRYRSLKVGRAFTPRRPPKCVVLDVEGNTFERTREPGFEDLI